MKTVTKESRMKHSRFFAMVTNNESWRMSEQDLTDIDKEILLEKAFASLYHWRVSGTERNVYLAYIIVSRALSINTTGEKALEYGLKALSYFENDKEVWISAFANLIVANAYGVLGKKRNFNKYYKAADALASQLTPEEMKFFNATRDMIAELD